MGGVSLLLGWCFELPSELDLAAFGEVRCIMSGYALRQPLRDGGVRYVPTRLSSVGALLAGPLRPDVLIVAVRPGSSGWTFGTEVAWMQAAVATGATVLAEVNHDLPRAAAVAELPKDAVAVLGETGRAPVRVDFTSDDGTVGRIAARAAALVPEGAVVQFGPGGIPDAVLAALEVPIEIDTGVITDGVRRLHERALLSGSSSGAYVVGTPELYDWADGRRILRGFEHTHDVSRLAAHRCFVALNTALEIDLVGQVNVERAGDDPLGSVGGHPDYASAAASSVRGLSIVALPTTHRGRSTLVERLSAPTSTPRADVDVIVTETGTVDLRGRSDAERVELIAGLWEHQ